MRLAETLSTFEVFAGWETEVGVSGGESDRWNCSGEGGGVIVFLEAGPNGQGSI